MPNRDGTGPSTFGRKMQADMYGKRNGVGCGAWGKGPAMEGGNTQAHGRMRMRGCQQIGVRRVARPNS